METIEGLKCVKCHEYLFNEPIQCSCGDRLCTPCFKELSRGTTGFSCPECEVVIEVNECFRDRAASTELKKVLVKCTHQGCSWQGKPVDYEVHRNECSIASSSLESDKKNIKPAQDALKECSFEVVGCRYLGTTKNLTSHLEINMKYHMKLLLKTVTDIKLSVTKQVQENTHAIRSIQEGCSEMALMVHTLQATSYNGTFIWKIPEVQQRRHEAKIGKTISLYSAPFYTSRQGYKACLRLYMDGDGCGKNTHLSFFVTIMKGEYDALLQWPFRHTVTLTLLDQDGDQHIAQCFVPDSSSPSFQRPSNDMNIASGFPMFAPQLVLSNPTYVKEDIIFFQCSISSNSSGSESM